MILKTVSAEDFPLQIGPFIDVLTHMGQVNQNLKQISKVLSQLSQNNVFPIKMQVPLQYSVNLQVEFANFKFNAPS